MFALYCPTYDVDQNRGEECPSYSRAILGLLDAAHELLVVVLEDQPKYREDDDAEYRDDEAARVLEISRPDAC